MPQGFSNFERGPKLIRGAVTIDGTLTTGAITGNITGNVTGNVTGNTSGTHTGPVIGGDVLVDASLVFGDAGASVLATVPAGQIWLVRDVVAVVDTAFDDTATLDLGSDGTTDGYLDGVDITSQGASGLLHADRGVLLYDEVAAGPPSVGSSRIDALQAGDEIVATISGTPTVGLLRVLVLGSRIA